jgi:hypothetical protein
MPTFIYLFIFFVCGPNIVKHWDSMGRHDTQYDDTGQNGIETIRLNCNTQQWRHYAECRDASWQYAECLILSIDMLSVIILSAVMLSVITLSAITAECLYEECD